MRRQKLVTLGCVTGVLACGACFLPPPSPRRPQPPRPLARIELGKSKRIRVTVMNNAEANAIDLAMMEGCVADSINNRHVVGVPPAVGGGSAQSDDAVLQVTMEKETAAQEPQQLSPGYTTWDFDVTLSAVLVRADGDAVRHAFSEVYRGVAVTRAGESPWTAQVFPARAKYYVCDPLVGRMLAGRG